MSILSIDRSANGDMRILYELPNGRKFWKFIPAKQGTGKA